MKSLVTVIARKPRLPSTAGNKLRYNQSNEVSNCGCVLTTQGRVVYIQPIGEHGAARVFPYSVDVLDEINGLGGKCCDSLPQLLSGRVGRHLVFAGSRSSTLV